MVICIKRRKFFINQQSRAQCRCVFCRCVSVCVFCDGGPHTLFRLLVWLTSPSTMILSGALVLLVSVSLSSTVRVLTSPPLNCTRQVSQAAARHQEAPCVLAGFPWRWTLSASFSDFRDRVCSQVLYGHRLRRVLTELYQSHSMSKVWFLYYYYIFIYLYIYKYIFIILLFLVC